MSYEARLKELGITLPEVPRPVAAYVPAVRTGNLVITSGQIPMVEGTLRYKGKVGKDVSPEEAYQAARLCALGALAAIRAQVGSLDRIEQIVKVTVFVSSDPSFTGQPEVANGASELFLQIFGDAGRHARSAVGCPVLPRDAAVEVEVLARVADGAGPA